LLGKLGSAESAHAEQIVDHFDQEHTPKPSMASKLRSKVKILLNQGRLNICSEGFYLS